MTDVLHVVGLAASSELVQRFRFSSNSFLGNNMVYGLGRSGKTVPIPMIVTVLLDGNVEIFGSIIGHASILEMIAVNLSDTFE